jgi:hypothetical protein
MYLTQALKELKVDSYLWNNDISAFDVFDQTMPDLFITSARSITKDIMKRLNGSNIDVIVNCTGLEDQYFSQLEEAFENIKKKPRLFYKNDGSHTVCKIEACADIFMSEVAVKSPTYDVDTLYIADSLDSINAYKAQIKPNESYHIFSPYKDIVESVDLSVPLLNLSKLYKNYKRIVVTKLSQIFYDAAYSGGSCEILSEKTPIFLKKEVAKKQHTPYNRVSVMFSKIGEKGIAEAANQKVQQIND